MKYDLAIIGGGPAGYNAAELAASNGLKVVIFQKDKVGGVCLNEGCIPTKTLLYSAKIMENAKHASKYGVNISGVVTCDWDKILKRKTKVVRKLVAGIKSKLAQENITLVEGEAHVLSQENNTFDIECNGVHFESCKVLFCTGSDVFIPPIDGLDKVDFWTSKEALECKTIPSKIVIIGGGVIGIEFASLFNSFGAKVVVVELMSEILGATDGEIAKMLREEYGKRGVEFHIETKVVAVSNLGVKTVGPDGENFIEADKILMCVGRKAVIPKGLSSLGVEFDNKGVKVNSYMQTTNKSIYAAGDITGVYQLAHVAIREGEVAVNHILGKSDEMKYNAIPSVVYTNPEIAGAGETEATMMKKNKRFKIYKLPLAYSGRFVAENEGANGLCKIIVDEENKIVGCHMIGNPSSEIILFASTCIQNGETVDQLMKHIYPHPTVSEIIHEVVNGIH